MNNWKEELKRIAREMHFAGYTTLEGRLKRLESFIEKTIKQEKKKLLEDIETKIILKESTISAHTDKWTRWKILYEELQFLIKEELKNLKDE